MSETVDIFDRQLVRRHRDRAATRFGEFDFLFQETADRLADRLDDVLRKFPLALDLGAHGGELAQVLNGRGGIQTLLQADLSPALLARAPDGPKLAVDEEFLPFAEGCLDLVLSNLSLHWVNDLPGTLLQVRRMLRPDGLFIASLLGGDTLIELRRAWMEAEIELEGGAGIHVSPFADVRDLGGLLQRAGFTLPVVDSETITVTYDNAFKLMADLRGMGEGNAVKNRRKTPARRATLMKMAECYHRLYAGEDGRIPATFQIITVTAWSPHESQPQPLKPGSATANLADFIGKDGGCG